jgi:Flp pilus assembly protein CpaB
MRKRDVVVIGGVLAVVIATAVVLTTHDCHDSPKSDSCPGDWRDPGLVVVLVATQDVPAGQTMDSLVEDDLLKKILVPIGRVVRGAATDLSQIEGKTSTRPIAKDEQISLAYLR